MGIGNDMGNAAGGKAGLVHAPPGDFGSRVAAPGLPGTHGAPADNAMVCRTCGAVRSEGRWQWLPLPAEAARGRCPACQRIRRAEPAGVVKLEFPRGPAGREPIRRLVRQQEAKEKRTHPPSRIMRIRDLPDGIEVTTTDTLLPRRIGQAMVREHGGQVRMAQGSGEPLLRVRWSRGGRPGG
jgi:NMD protein affecting ribosome stability and mRNA decay